MSNRRPVCLLLALTLVSIGMRIAAAATPENDPSAAGYVIEAEPRWVEVSTAPEAAANPSQSVAGGADYLLLDRQVTFAEVAQTYVHMVVRLLNQSGVSDQSQLQVQFDPEVEVLRLHHVIIRRGSERIDALARGRPELLRREPDLEGGVLYGALTFHLLLADVRVGDIIDYSYTIDRRDAEWGNRHFARFSTTWDGAVGLSRLWVRVREAAPLFVGNHDGLKPEESVKEGWRVLQWVWKNVPAQPADGETPSWYEKHSSIEISQFANWREVAQVALPLYGADFAPSPELTALIGRLRATGDSDGVRALAAMRFVQDDIRYTGIELGEGAYRPTRPSEVLKRRYGDCKDKVLLAVTLLRGLGIEADPALVSTYWRHELGTRLSSPGAMNHVIVRARINGTEYWWDATASAQGGTLRDFVQSDLGTALVIAPGTDALQSIPQVISTKPLIVVKSTFDLRTGLDKAARLDVSTRYAGDEADDMRRRLRSTSLEQLGRDYENYYKSRYARLRSVSVPTYHDDLLTNVLTVDEHYTAETFFEEQDGGRREFGLDADVITTSLRKPERTSRSAPLSLAYPRSVAVQQVVRLPEGWPVDDGLKSVMDDGFRYSSRVSHVGNDVYLDYEYRTLADHVGVERMPAFLERQSEARDDSYFSFTYRPAGGVDDVVPADPEQALRQSASLVTIGKLKEARDILQKTIDSPAFRDLAGARQYVAYRLAGSVAVQLGDMAGALPFLRRSAAMQGADADDWIMRMRAASASGAMDEAFESLVTLLQRWPAEGRKIDVLVVSRLLRAGGTAGSARYRLLSALSQADYLAPDGEDLSDWWVDLLREQLDRNDLAGARRTVARITGPRELITLRADNRFVPVRGLLTPDQDVARATQRRMDERRRIVREEPDKLYPLIQLTYALLEVGRNEEVLEQCQQVIARMGRAGGKAVYKDSDEYRWILDNRSRALFAMGRYTESIEQLIEAERAAGAGTDKVSQKINLAARYIELSRTAEALALMQGIDANKASPYGKMQIVAVRIDIAAQQGNAAEVESQLRYMHDHQADALGTYQSALLSANRLDEAALTLQARLADPEQRSEALREVQNYRQMLLPEWPAMLSRRWNQLVQRPEVQAAIRDVGAIGKYDLLPEMR